VLRGLGDLMCNWAQRLAFVEHAVAINTERFRELLALALCCLGHNRLPMHMTGAELKKEIPIWKLGPQRCFRKPSPLYRASPAFLYDRLVWPIFISQCLRPNTGQGQQPWATDEGSHVLREPACFKHPPCLSNSVAEASRFRMSHGRAAMSNVSLPRSRMRRITISQASVTMPSRSTHSALSSSMGLVGHSGARCSLEAVRE